MPSEPDTTAVGISHRPYLGFGLGLRPPHYQTILDTEPAIDWFEIISENYMVPGGKPLDYLSRIRERYPLVMHGVSMSIGSTDPLNWDYLHRLKALASWVEPAWISDHLCWTGVQKTNLHDLLPLPYTEEAIYHVALRLKQVQDFLGRRLLIENVSSYLTYTHSEMMEWEFVRAVCEEADCGMLLDVNNVYVSARNHGFEPRTYIDHIPIDRVYQLHLAGHTSHDSIIIDTHDQSIIDPVWALYAYTIGRLGKVSTMIERDDRIPPLEQLLAELTTARRIADPIFANQGAAA